MTQNSKLRNPDLEVGIGLLKTEICEQLNLKNVPGDLSTLSYESQIIAAVQYSVYLSHSSGQVVQADILQQLTPSGSKYSLQSAVLKPLDVSENLSYLDRVSALFDKCFEAELFKGGKNVSYGFAVEHSKTGEIPGYILLKVVQISPDAHQSIKDHLKIGDFILRVDNRLVCTCTANDPTMTDAEGIFEGTQGSMKVVIARNESNEAHEKLAKLYKTTKFVQILPEDGLNLKNCHEEMVVVSELEKSNENVSVGDHILRVNCVSVLDGGPTKLINEFDSANEKNESCIVQVASSELPEGSAHDELLKKFGATRTIIIQDFDVEYGVEFMKNFRQTEILEERYRSSVYYTIDGIKQFLAGDHILSVNGRSVLDINCLTTFFQEKLKFVSIQVGYDTVKTVENVKFDAEEDEETISPEQDMLNQLANRKRKRTIHHPTTIKQRIKEVVAKLMPDAPDDKKMQLEEKLTKIFANQQFDLIKIAWDYFDRDEDGFISRQEFHNFMSDDIVTSRIGQLPAKLIDPIFNKIDLDGTDMLDLFEFLTIIKEDEHGDLMISINFKKY